MTSKSSRGNPGMDSRRLFLSGPASMIWTTTSSSSYGTTLGIHNNQPVTPHHPNHLHNSNVGACMTLAASHNNNRSHNVHPMQQQHQQALNNHHHVSANSSGGSSSSASSFNNNSSCSTSTLAPLITPGNSQDNTTRINNYAFNNHFKTTGRSHNHQSQQQASSPQVNPQNSVFAPAFQTARDRKPLTPEYEVPAFVNNNHHQSLFSYHQNPYLHQSLDRLDQDFLSSLPVSGSSPTTTSLEDDNNCLHQTSLTSDDKSNHIYSHIYDPASLCDRHSSGIIRHPVSEKLNYFSHHPHHHRAMVDFDPIQEEIEKRRRRKCLLLGSLFTIAVFLGILLLSSFIMFVVSSYQVEVLKTEELKQQVATIKTTDGFKEAGVLSKELETELAEGDAVLNHTEALLVATEKSVSSSDSSSNNNILISTNINNNNNNVVNNNYTIVKSDEDLNCLEGHEWKCRDGLCIPQEKRCDGHFNCYDHSDEYNCDPCPVSEGFFRCGSETSCLDPSKRCDSIIDCWDGSDEHLCIK